jgi:hypothetical protein
MRMSAFGTKRTYRDVRYLSAFGGKADINRDCLTIVIHSAVRIERGLGIPLQ